MNNKTIKKKKEKVSVTIQWRDNETGWNAEITKEKYLKLEECIERILGPFE